MAHPIATWLGRRFGATIVWLPFDLHPEYPPEGVPRAELLARYGAEMTERMRATFAERGLEYNPHPDLVPNTMKALRLTELARELGRHEETHDRLMDAYWVEAQDLGDSTVLRALAAELRLPGDEVEAVLDGDRYRERIESSTRQAVSIGATGVPAFLLDGAPARPRSPARGGLRAGLRGAGDPVTEFIDELEGGFGWIEDERSRRAAHALAVDGRVYLIDPFEADGLEERVRELGEPAGVIQLLDRHGRDSAALAARLDVPLHVVPDSLPGTFFTFLRVSSWRRWQEVALWWPERQILVCADVLGTIPFFRAGAEPIGVHPFLRPFPPRSLRRLAPLHVLVGHGTGRHGESAGAEVDDALAHARRRIPRWLLGLRRALGAQS